MIERMHAPLEVMLIGMRYAADRPSGRPAEPASRRGLMAKRGVDVADASVRRWTVNVLPALATVFRQHKLPVGVDQGCRPMEVLVPGCASASSPRKPAVLRLVRSSCRPPERARRRCAARPWWWAAAADSVPASRTPRPEFEFNLSAPPWPAGSGSLMLLAGQAHLDPAEHAVVGHDTVTHQYFQRHHAGAA